MSIGNPNKFETLSKLKQALKQGKSETGDTVTKLYMNKRYETRKALKFKTCENKSKLV